MAPFGSFLRPGDLVAGSPYRLGRVLGEGGTATVFEAEDTSCGKAVVVKVLRPHAIGIGAFTAESMQREAHLLVELQRRTEHVVEVITAGVTSDARRLPYYVMERLEGNTLEHRLASHRARGQLLAVDEALGIGIHLAGALAAAHGLGIVHRDVKPANAFIHRRRDGFHVLKLLDFGIAAHAGDAGGKGFAGTHRYASPEQLRGEPPTGATDIYALGLVLFEALTLRGPFELSGRALGPAALEFAHRHTEPPRVSSVRPEVPASLDEVIALCLAKDPGDRVERADALQHALRQIGARFERELVGAPSSLAAITEVDAPPEFTVTHVPEPTPVSHETGATEPSVQNRRRA